MIAPTKLRLPWCVRLGSARTPKPKALRHPVGLIASDFPRLLPDLSSASTATYAGRELKRSAVSRPSQGPTASGFREPAALPPRMRHWAMSVLPFQLASTIVLPSFRAADSAGRPPGFPDQSPLKAR